MRLVIEHVGFRVGDRVVLDDIRLEVPTGSLTGLIGPNGSGKSTLLRLLSGVLTPQTGIVWLDDRRLWDLDAPRSASLLGGVTPATAADLDRTVGELVDVARAELDPCVDELVAALGLDELRDRRLDRLSEGERQRVVLVRALARRPSVLVMDEPFGQLDVRYQHRLLGMVRRLAVTTLVVLRDVNLAAAYCDRIVMLADGRITAAGSAAEVLVPDLIEDAFGITATAVVHPRTGCRQWIFYPVDDLRAADEGADVAASQLGVVIPHSMTYHSCGERRRGATSHDPLTREAP